MSTSLIELALEGTDDARKRLFALVSDLVLANLDQRSERELELFSEVILELYGLSRLNDRTKLAASISSSPKAPLNLARKMAEDEIDVSTFLLTKCRVFTKEDVLHFATSLSDAHLQALARRPDLTTEASDRIAERGGKAVYRILAGNHEIRLSGNTVSRLVTIAQEDETLLKDLSYRSDLSASACRAMLPLVDEETRKRLQETIDAALSKEQLEQFARLKTIRREFGQTLESTDMSLLWREAERSGVSVDELAILLLQDGRFNHATELIGARGRIAQKTFKDAVFKGKPDLVVRTAAKAGLQAPTFALFAKSRCEHLKIPSAQGSEWTAAYVKFLEKNRIGKQSRCGDFQANRKEKR
ncbi:DUF2336 domain-containing protein [Roseibium sp. SCP14]|uniref:DUF2336 domain-containing protein n=1 Tax=Roseibium sp. SCP14 TaxID=3141375 RepID=UPI003337293B